MKLSDLQREAHAIAKGKGWWDQERTFGDCMADVHEGLSRARKAHRKWGDTEPHYDGRMVDTEDGPYPVTIRLEDVPFALAEVVIRMADMAEWYGEVLIDIDLSEANTAIANESSFGGWITFLHQLVSGAAFNWQVKDKGIVYPLQWVNSLSEVVVGACNVAAHYGIDLDAAIAAKLAYMRSSGR